MNTTEPKTVPTRWSIDTIRDRFSALPAQVLAADWTRRMPTEIAVLIEDMRVAGGGLRLAAASMDLTTAIGNWGFGQGWTPTTAQIRRAHKTWYARTGQAKAAVPSPRKAAQFVVDPDAAYEPIRVALDESGWRDTAACLGQDPELFFPIGDSEQAQAQTEEAKTWCRQCPVVNACFTWAMRQPGTDGVWGCTTEGERRSIHRRALRDRRQAGTPAIAPPNDRSRRVTLRGNPRPR